MRAPPLTFLATVLAIDAAIHWYLWARLVRDSGWSPPVRLAATIGIAVLGACMFAGMIASRRLPRAVARPIALAAYVWLGTMFYLFVAMVAVDVLRMFATGVAWLWSAAGGDPVGPDLVRRKLISGGAAQVAGSAAAGTSLIALGSGLGEVDVKEVGVKLARLPRPLDGLTIVQLTDVHVGPTIGRRFVEAIVEKTNRARPDVVVITGDLVDGSVPELQRHVAPLAKLAARYGVYFITGNHEYYSGVEAWTAELERLGISVLRNRKVTVGDAATIDLAGIDDHLVHEFAEPNGGGLKSLLDLTDPERELILLAHQPKAIVSAAEAGVGLQLSGHTHGGQIWPFSGIVALTQPYLAGLHRHGPSTQIYVSRGTGYWGPPMRLLAPAEVTKIVLGVA